MTHIIIATAILAPAYLLLLLAHPVHRCPSCGGRKVARRRGGYSRCPRCKGHGRAYRRGAVTVHRLVREHAWPWLRDRINDAIASRIGGDS